jgi:hypothetical protein
MQNLFISLGTQYLYEKLIRLKYCYVIETYNRRRINDMFTKPSGVSSMCTFLQNLSTHHRTYTVLIFKKHCLIYDTYT